MSNRDRCLGLFVGERVGWPGAPLWSEACDLVAGGWVFLLEVWGREGTVTGRVLAQCPGLVGLWCHSFCLTLFWRFISWILIPSFQFCSIRPCDPALWFGLRSLPSGGGSQSFHSSFQSALNTSPKYICEGSRTLIYTSWIFLQFVG